MNKTVNINLAGIFFHIDEDAYLKLQRYLDAIRRSFTDSQGRSEIIADIEARIAELFSERIQNDKQVVGTALVDEVITIMGQPEDYLVDDEIFEDEPVYEKRQRSSQPTKKLYRDTENSYIGGVAAGLGHYLSIDVIWIRLLWILFALMSGGTFIIIYLVFWALVPEAVTTAEKLMMKGEPVNISNIEKKIKDGIDTVTEKVKNVDFKVQGEKLKEGIDQVTENISEGVKKVDIQKQGNRLKSSSQKFFDGIGSIITFFLKVIAKFIGIILIIVGISSLLGLIVALFTVGITDAVHFPGIDFLEAANTANIPIWLMSLLLFFAIGIPFFFVFYLGLKVLVSNLKSIGNVAKFTLLGVWLMAIIGIIIIGIRQATEHAFDANTSVENSLNIKAGDTLTIAMKSSNQFNKFPYRSTHGYKISRTDDGEQVISTNDIRLIIRSSKDSVGRINVDKYAYGNSYDTAKERSEKIDYNYELSNGKLLLNSYLTTDISNKFSDQHVEVIIYLPEGTILYADDNTSSFHRNSSYYNDILDYGQEEQFLEIVEDDIICLDCLDEDSIDEKANIRIKTESIDINLNEEGLETEDAKIEVEIDEKDGVKISSGKNNI